MAVRFEYACKPLLACAEIHRWILMNVCDAEISSGVKNMRCVQAACAKFSQINVIVCKWVLRTRGGCVRCMCVFVCFCASHITNIISVVGSGDMHVWVCVPQILRTPHEFKSMSLWSNLLYIQSASFHCSLLNYPLIGHATKAADEKDNFLLLIGHFTCASCTPVCSWLGSVCLCMCVCVSHVMRIGH